MLPRRILIANAWGSNRGDEAMLNTLHGLIATAWPGAHVDVAPFRDEELQIKPEMNVLRRRIGVNHYVERPRLLERVIRTRRGSRAFKNVLNRFPRVWKATLRRFVSRYDFVFHAPQGPSIGDLYPIQNDILRILDAAQEARTRYGIVGVSMGPFSNGKEEREDLTFKVLRRAEGVILREDISLGYVQERYPSLRNVDSAIDIVFSTPPPTREDIIPHLAAHGDLVDWLDGETIGACISLSPARHPNNAFDRDAYVASFSKLLNHVLRTTRRRVLLFSHINHDLPSLRRLVEHASEPARVRVFPPALDSSVQRGAIGQLGFFISTRYHPTIFAVQSQIPFFCVKNQFKVDGMLAKVGLADIPSCWQDAAADEQCRAFDDTWSARDHVQAQLGPAALKAAEWGRVYLDRLRHWGGAGSTGVSA
jgi:polysaccharide pyruvyl transferase WcaK-like protein